MNNELLTTSDVSTAIVGAGFASVYQNLGTPVMGAVKALVFSVVARMVAKSKIMGTTTTDDQKNQLTTEQKNQLVVAILAAAEAYSRSKNQSIGRAVLSGVSIDLIGQEVLKLMKLEDTVLIGGEKGQ